MANDSHTPTVQELSDYYNNLMYTINYWYLITVMPIGIITNSLAICVYTRRTLFDKTMMGFYYTNIAIWNVVNLSYQMFVMQYQVLFGVDLYALSNVSCKLLLLN